MKNKVTVAVVLYTVPLVVCGYYTPEEPVVMYYKDGSGNPGSASEFEITEVYANDLNITGVLNDDTIELLEELACRKVED